jgi:hypothetical protein
LEDAKPLATISIGTSKLVPRSLVGDFSAYYYSTREYAGVIGKNVAGSAVQCSGGPKI